MALHRTLTAAALAALVALGAAAQPARPGKSPLAKPGPGMAEEDRQFANRTAASGIAEFELAKLARQIAVHRDVKKYAERIVADHGKVNDELKALAAAKRIPLPTAPSRVTQIELDKLQKHTGAAFDVEYMRHMVKDHQKGIAEFEKQAKSGKDADLKKWAEQKLPTLQEHLKLAEAALAAASKGKKK
jgi:putative membrane protein